MTTFPDATRFEPLPVQDPHSIEGHDRSFADMMERLFRQFEDRVPLPTIVRVARESRDQLSGSPAGAMPELTERLAIARLTELGAAGSEPATLNPA